MVPKAVITLAVAFSAVLAVAATTNKRIIGGEVAKEGDCSTTVVTAAHCRMTRSAKRALLVAWEQGAW